MDNRTEIPLDLPAQSASVSFSTPPVQGQGNTTSRAVVEALFRHRSIMFWTATAVLALTVLYIVLIPRTYQSEMNILVRNARPDYLLSPEKNNGSTPLPDVTEEKINSEIEVLRSKDVADQVVDANWNSKPLADRTLGEVKEHEKSVLYYGKHLTIESLRKSNVIHVTYTASSPRIATETVQHLLDGFLAKQREIERSTGASQFFASEAQRYKSELDEAQQQLAGYQQHNQIVSLPEKETTLEKQIAALEDQIRATQVSITESSNRVSDGQSQLRSIPARQSTSERLIPNTYTVEQLTTLLANLQNQRTAMLVKFLPGDRMVLELDKQIADTSASLRAATDARAMENTTDVNPVYQQVRSSVAQSSTELRALTGRLTDQNEQLARLKGSLVNVEGSTVDYTTLQSRVTELQSNYQLYSQKRNEAEIADAMDRQNLVNVAVAERPTFSAKAFRPEPLLNLSLGAFTAIFLAACMAFFAEMGRDTVSAPYELEALTRIPVLATVPLTDGSYYTPSRPPSTPHGGPAPTRYTPSDAPDWDGGGIPQYQPAGYDRHPSPTFAFQAAAPQPVRQPAPQPIRQPAPQPIRQAAPQPAVQAPVHRAAQAPAQPIALQSQQPPATAAAAWFAKVKQEATQPTPAPAARPQPIAAAPQPAAQIPAAETLMMPTARMQLAPPAQPIPPAQIARPIPAPIPQAPPAAAQAVPAQPPRQQPAIAPAPQPVAAAAPPPAIVSQPVPAPLAAPAALASPLPAPEPILATPVLAAPAPPVAVEAAPTKPNDPPQTIAPPVPQESPMLGFKKSDSSSIFHLSEDAAPAEEVAMVRDPISRPVLPQRPSQMRRAAFLLIPDAEQEAAAAAAPAERKSEPKPDPLMDRLLQEPVAHPGFPSRIKSGARAIERPAATPEPIRQPAAPAPVYIPPVREADEKRIAAASQVEPHHRPSAIRLAAIRDEVMAARPRLSPAQRALNGRPEAKRDRNGRLAYVTYTVDPRDKR